MKSEKKMEIIFQDKISNINIVNTIFGLVTDYSDESLTVMLPDSKFMIITINSLLEIKEWEDTDPTG